MNNVSTVKQVNAPCNYATMSQPPHHRTYGIGARKIEVAISDNALSCASFSNLTAKICVLNHCLAFDAYLHGQAAI